MSNEILSEFIEDAREHLAAAGSHLLALEKDHGAADELHGLLRRLHSIKGNAGFLDLDDLYRLLHKSENILQMVREQSCANCPPELMDYMFQVLDTVELMVDRIEEGRGDQSVGGLDALLGGLDDFDAALEAASAPLSKAEPAPEDAEAPIEIDDDFFKDFGPISEGPPSDPEPAPEPALEPLPMDWDEPEPESPAVPVPDDDLDWIVGLVEAEFEEQGPALPGLAAGLAQNGAPALVFDLAGLSTLTSSRLGLLISAGKKFSDPQKIGLILDPSRQAGLVRVLEVMGLDRVFLLYKSREEARREILG